MRLLKLLYNAQSQQNKSAVVCDMSMKTHVVIRNLFVHKMCNYMEENKSHSTSYRFTFNIICAVLSCVEFFSTRPITSKNYLLFSPRILGNLRRLGLCYDKNGLYKFKKGQNINTAFLTYSDYHNRRHIPYMSVSLPPGLKPFHLHIVFHHLSTGTNRLSFSYSCFSIQIGGVFRRQGRNVYALRTRMSAIDAIVAFFDIQPSLYFHWISTREYVTEDSAYIDQMAAQGLFPKLQQLYPSIIFALLLGLCRYFLQYYFFKVCIFSD